MVMQNEDTLRINIYCIKCASHITNYMTHLYYRDPTISAVNRWNLHPFPNMGPLKFLHSKKDCRSCLYNHVNLVATMVYTIWFRDFFKQKQNVRIGNSTLGQYLRRLLMEWEVFVKRCSFGHLQTQHWHWSL